MITWYSSSSKRFLDLGVASFLLILSLPLAVSLALLIKLTSHGPIIFSQKRLGKKGKPFTLYKFRTMVPDAEKLQKKLKPLNEADGPVFKIRHDPRFTRFGKWLAHSGLDELPQLFNVLMGDMSLVGPRPLPLGEARQIPAKWRLKRERVRPGIVSSWVVHGSQQLKFSRWMELDLKDQTNSFRHDLRVLWFSSFIILGKFQDLGKRFLHSLPHSRQILMVWIKKLFHHALANPTWYSLGLLYLIVFSLFFLNGGEALSGQILFLAVPLLSLPLVFVQPHTLPKQFPLIAGLWLLYLVLNLASTLTSTSLSLSVPVLVRLAAVFVYWVLFSLLFDHQKQLKVLTNIIIGVGFLLALVGLYFLLPQTPKPLAGMNLFYAKYGHNHLASYLLVVLPLVLARWINRSESVLWRNLSLFFLANLLLTFSRGAFVILPLITLVILLLYRPKRFQALFLGAVAIVPLLLLLGIMLISHTSWAESKRGKENFPWIERQLVKPVNSEGRLNYWQQAWQGWQWQPLLGNGPGTFRLVSLRFQKEPGAYSTFAHSSVLEHLTETGILGTVAFLLLTLIPLIWLWRRHLSPFAASPAFPLLVGTTALWLHSLIDFNFNFTALLLLFWVNIAALMATKMERDKSESLSRLAFSGIAATSIALFIFASFSIAGKILLLKAEQAKNQNQVSQALHWYQRSLQLFPFDQAQWQVVLKSFQDSHLPVPQNLISQATLLNKENPRVLTLIALEAENQNQLEQAKSRYYQLIKLDPNTLEYYLKLSQISAQSGQAQESLTYLSQAVQLESRQQVHLYPELIAPSPFQLTLPEDNPALINAYLSYWKGFNGVSRIEKPDQLAKIIYRVGLLAYQNNQPDLVIPLWQTAVLLAPEWSYFHIELATFYWTTQQADLAQQTLDFCLKFSFPRDHCQQVLRLPPTERNALQPGQFAQNIDQEL